MLCGDKKLSAHSGQVQVQRPQQYGLSGRFAEELRRQIKMLESVVITDEEIAFMRRRCSYIPAWFYSYLKGFRYDSRWVTVNQDEEGHLDIVFEGCWSNTIFLEVKVLAIISELYYIMTGQDASFDYECYYAKSYAKARRLIEAGCTFSDFGTRRRASFKAQDTVIRAMKECRNNISAPGSFTGTSNVYFAMKYDLVPIGTMAHELICAIAGMYGPQMANNIAMKIWANTYRGALGTFLYDTYGWRIFSLNFSEDYANMFKGLRIDSGDNFHELDLITKNTAVCILTRAPSRLCSATAWMLTEPSRYRSMRTTSAYLPSALAHTSPTISPASNQ